MRMHIEIMLEGADFTDNFGGFSRDGNTVARVLRALAERVDQTSVVPGFEFTGRDINGNPCLWAAVRSDVMDYQSKDNPLEYFPIEEFRSRLCTLLVDAEHGGHVWMLNHLIDEIPPQILPTDDDGGAAVFFQRRPIPLTIKVTDGTGRSVPEEEDWEIHLLVHDQPLKDSNGWPLTLDWADCQDEEGDDD